ncbi:MAG: acyl-CoA desaturase [Fimbriiglobus sp.]
MFVNKTSDSPAVAPLTSLPARTHAVPDRLSLGGQLVTIIGVTAPPAGLVAAAALSWEWGFHWADLGLLLGMYLLTLLGITVGYHRLFVHKSFETYLPVKVVFTAMGSMAFQGSMIHWAGLHRWHHQHSDNPEDVHSPHHGGRGILGALRGFWHAHIGWAFFADPPGLERYVRDLTKSPTLRWASGLFPLWALLGLAIPAALGGLITGTWAGAGTGLLWGGLVRILLVHHVTWSVNSVCHLWGRRTYRSADESRDNVLFGILALGEGWHNTHHAFPTSARHGLRWWQLDISYMVIRSLSLTGLAWNLKLPSEEAQHRERRTPVNV